MNKAIAAALLATIQVLTDPYQHALEEFEKLGEAITAAPCLDCEVRVSTELLIRCSSSRAPALRRTRRARLRAWAVADAPD